MIDKLLKDLEQVHLDMREERDKVIVLKQNPARFTVALGSIRNAIDNLTAHEKETAPAESKPAA
jgi:cell division septum initiation protein DivIVA